MLNVLQQVHNYKKKCANHVCNSLPAKLMMLADAGMVGDVNLFLNDADDPNTGEIEVTTRLAMASCLAICHANTELWYIILVISYS